MNIIISPIIGVFTLANTILLTKSFIANSSHKKDKFKVQLSPNEIYFYNEGIYPIVITDISIKYIEEEGISVPFQLNLLKKQEELKSNSELYMEVDFPISKIYKEKEILYLCFDIKSESGRHYDSICCKLKNRQGKLNTRKLKLRKEIHLIKE